MSCHFVSLKGERDSNEDCHNIILGLNRSDNKMSKINFYGVYDGHGGKYVSKYLSTHLPPLFIHNTVSYPLTINFVNKTYDSLCNDLFNNHEKECTDCGSTCLIVCHFRENNKDFLNILNSGDSRCVLCRNNIGIPLTKDHKPEWPDETNRIKKLGGQIRKDGCVYRINDLSVSRAFGDKESSKYVTYRPEIYKYKIRNKDKFMIIACDGLWDVFSNQDAVNFVLERCYDSSGNRINHNVNISRKLAEKAIHLDSGDNITCIIVFFD
jgi:protein phosphatase 1L